MLDASEARWIRGLDHYQHDTLFSGTTPVTAATAKERANQVSDTPSRRGCVADSNLRENSYLLFQPDNLNYLALIDETHLLERSSNRYFLEVLLPAKFFFSLVKTYYPPPVNWGHVKIIDENWWFWMLSSYCELVFTPFVCFLKFS